MNPSWKQLLACGTATAIVGYLGYKYYTLSIKQRSKKQEASDNAKAKAKPSPNTSSTENPKKGKSKKANNKKVAREPMETLPEEISEVMEQCELSATELLRLTGEERQRVFYALLSKGEFMLNQGTTVSIPKALDYFTKAVSIVPNPGEVVAAFEKMLPPPLFNALLDKIQRKSKPRPVITLIPLLPRVGKLHSKK